MRRGRPFVLVRTHGGKPREGVTKRTDVLIVGEFGWPLHDDGRPSNSLARAKSYRVLIASERQFRNHPVKAAVIDCGYSVADGGCLLLARRALAALRRFAIRLRAYFMGRSSMTLG